jgi:hypothetical protein
MRTGTWRWSWGPTSVQVSPEPVGLHLRGPGAHPVLGTPRGQTMVLLEAGGLRQGAEEGVDPEAVGQVPV